MSSSQRMNVEDSMPDQIIEESGTAKTMKDETPTEKISEEAKAKDSAITLEGSPLTKKIPSFTYIYDKEYGAAFEENLGKDQPDYSNALKNTDITPNLRAKMVDWMIEVMGHYAGNTTQNTWFLAVHIMDLFFKKSSKRLRDGDVHLIGIASMLIATKYEDVYHIPLQDFVQHVAHNKFSS
jgi:hypothetical protein